MKKREYGADVIRIISTYFIIAVHFYLNYGFYYEPQKGIFMVLADCARSLFYICVPLFAMLTGYLKCRAIPSKKYYQGIIPILFTWIIISFICIGFKIAYQHQYKNFIEWLAEFLDYKAANYSWYIELYISLFLFCPLINALFLNEKKYIIVSLVTFMLLAFLPSVGNGYKVGEVQLDFVPNYIGSIWPFAYYIMGAGVQIFQPKIPRMLLGFIMIFLSIVTGLLTFFTSNGGRFSDGYVGGYSNWLVALMTLVMFLLLYQCHTQCQALQRIATHISSRCLIIYLISWIFDMLIQPILQPYTEPKTYWWVFIVHTGSVFVLSLVASEIIYPIISFLSPRKKSSKI